MGPGFLHTCESLLGAYLHHKTCCVLFRSYSVPLLSVELQGCAVAVAGRGQWWSPQLCAVQEHCPHWGKADGDGDPQLLLWRRISAFPLRCIL